MRERLPAGAADAKKIDAWQQSFTRWLRQSQPLKLWYSTTLKQSSMAGESERDFRIRLQDLASAQRDVAVEKLRKKYAPKRAALDERMRRAQLVVERERAQSNSQKLDAAVSFGTAVLGALLAPWAVASATGVLGCGPRRSIRMAAPHIVWAMTISGLLFAAQFAGQTAIELVPLPFPAITLGGVTLTDAGYDLQILALGSVFAVAGQVAAIAIAMRAGVTPDGHRALRDTFS